MQEVSTEISLLDSTGIKMSELEHVVGGQLEAVGYILVEVGVSTC
jgi:hypothetical protein